MYYISKSPGINAAVGQEAICESRLAGFQSPERRNCEHPPSISQNLWLTKRPGERRRGHLLLYTNLGGIGSDVQVEDGSRLLVRWGKRTMDGKPGYRATVIMQNPSSFPRCWFHDEKFIDASCDSSIRLYRLETFVKFISEIWLLSGSNLTNFQE